MLFDGKTETLTISKMEENPVKSGSAISRKSSKIVPVENGEAEPKSKTGSAVSRKSTIVVSEATNDDKSETKSIKRKIAIIHCHKYLYSIKQYSTNLSGGS